MILDALRSLDAVRWSAAVTVTSGQSVVASDHLGADEVLPTASVGKILLLLAVLDDIEHGMLHRAERVEVTIEDLVADSGLLHHLDEPRLGVLDLCRFVGAVSDNLATNMLIRRVGLDRVTALTESLGLRRCALHRPVRDARRPDDLPHLSTGAAGEWEQMMRRLHGGDAVSPAVAEQMVDLLRLNTDLSMVAAAFGLDPLAHVDEDLGVRLFNKTGTQSGTRADIGCVVVGERVAAYAVIARFEDSYATRSGVLDAMRDVGAQIRTACQAT